MMKRAFLRHLQVKLVEATTDQYDIHYDTCYAESIRVDL